MPAVIFAVLLTSAPLVRAEAQTPVPTPISLPRDSASNASAMYRRLASPCQGVALAMLDVSINTGGFAPRTTALLRRAYPVMLPVLVEAALNPALTAAPHLLRERMAAQVSAGQLYTAQQVLETRRLLTAALAEDPPAEGAAVVAAILADSELGPPWRATLANLEHRYSTGAGIQ